MGVSDHQGDRGDDGLVRDHVGEAGGGRTRGAHPVMKSRMRPARGKVGSEPLR